jgi:hypothetical protein
MMHDIKLSLSDAIGALSLCITFAMGIWLAYGIGLSTMGVM